LNGAVYGLASSLVIVFCLIIVMTNAIANRDGLSVLRFWDDSINIKRVKKQPE